MSDSESEDTKAFVGENMGKKRVRLQCLGLLRSSYSQPRVADPDGM